MTAVGWEFIVWTGEKRRCNVPSCSRETRAGHVRVDNRDPEADGFVVLCVDCYSMIMFGVDPGGDPLPDWERENRAKETN